MKQLIEWILSIDNDEDKQNEDSLNQSEIKVRQDNSMIKSLNRENQFYQMN